MNADQNQRKDKRWPGRFRDQGGNRTQGHIYIFFFLKFSHHYEIALPLQNLHQNATQTHPSLWLHPANHLPHSHTQRGFPAQAGCSRGLAPVLFGLPKTLLFSRARAPGAVTQLPSLPVDPQQCSSRCWVPGLRAGQRAGGWRFPHASGLLPGPAWHRHLNQLHHCDFISGLLPAHQTTLKKKFIKI